MEAVSDDCYYMIETERACTIANQFERNPIYFFQERLIMERFFLIAEYALS